ncbi:SNF2 helicase associated domain-containing protein [Brevibacillus ginsengisoli]|uniref:DEAD/DEAH box helicase n=1 Tax=Brevibacillus ginsengisoli TaxID=363854 RepID=UPI003CFA17D9
MSFQLTKKMIKSWCGPYAYQKGEAFNRAKKVMFTQYDPDSVRYKATVKGTNSYEVSIQFYSHGEIEAECSCPTLGSYDQYCQHISAVLISLYDLQQSGYPPVQATASKGDTTYGLLDDLQVTNRILGLFDEKPKQSIRNHSIIETRMLLDVEFICKVMTYSNSISMIGIEMKLGPKQLYIVQNVKDFLGLVDQRKACFFTKHFTYDPTLHTFEKENEAVIRQLILINQEEQTYREAPSMYTALAARTTGERTVIIPPHAWKTLLPLLIQAPKVKLIHDEQSYGGIQVSDEPLPLHCAFDQASHEGYQLSMDGLDQMTVMESYGVVFSEGKLMKLSADQCKRLASLKEILNTSGKHHIQIQPDQIDTFMEKVVPGLMQLGNVHITQAVSSRVVQKPLQAKMYLDRVRDRLLVGLEFHYGDIVINPLEQAEGTRRSHRILIRDREQEQLIMGLIEQSPFTKTEGGYYMTNEEAEFEFLYQVIPELEKLVKVYATSAVKTRIHMGQALPKVSVRVDVDERINWLDFRLNMDWIPESEIRHLLEALEEKRSYYRLANGSLLPLEGADFKDLSHFMNELGLRSKDFTGAEIRMPAIRGLPLLDKETKSVKLGKSLRHLLENLRNPDNLEFSVPDSLAPVLRDYQTYGFQWLKTLAHYGYGGILADDMGLGKTIQSIAFIVSALPEIRDTHMPAIVVAPTSLVYNWRNEFGKFASEIRVAIADGDKSQRRRTLQQLAEADVIITSYPLLRRDYDLYEKHGFHSLFLDEAQAFKNHATQTAQAVKRIKAQQRFALTGTPVENHLEDLWSIFHIVLPELFQDQKSFNNLSREQVAKRMRPFLLRRVKQDVLKELPEKMESMKISELLPEQKKLYVAYLARLQQETLKHLSANSLQKNKLKILAGLTRLRQICCHPGLFVEGYKGSSAKMEQLMEILEECRGAGKRVLVFSQFTEMLGLIKKELGDLGLPYFYLDGKTPTPERVDLCNRFNDGEVDLFLLSLKAGGTGLNLTGADTVILYDLWWNPAVEQQAADRAHRIGQKNVVQIIRLVTKDTMEEKMNELQQKKKNLIAEVIQPGEASLSSISEQDIREILMLEEGNQLGN